MEMPSWRDTDTKRGSMARGALWLVQEIGINGIFTKSDVREAFPEVSQIDRRLRDLRDYGWQIDTHREDPELKQDEQRLVQVGAEVWVPGQAKAKPKTSVTAAQRKKVMEADGWLCRSCGLAGGDIYDDGATAQLDIARRNVLLPDGTEEVQLSTECKKCRVGGRGSVVDLGEILRLVELLGPLEKTIFGGWLSADERRLSGMERLWGLYRAMPADSRAAVRRAVLGDDELGVRV
ncbi:hypothetical protein BAY61_00105 [Prauserella marina]|uniref:Uncharacterized protein n=1 Tax=Prauserella marina TaxID=530584 RepID=A0A222VIJ6_9PSEU|nr:hypothetical protein [Prauserella marina]ASR33652.1 hypothetical protein BAY61_00105 [Prauserella marina]PWV82195.1 hypothetical protein DES30_102433 [Prauserella marina]SDD21369.1 hypothetical protein SAMN05421630_106433 [Prauserella marina]